MHSPVVLGIDFGGTKIAAAVSDLHGNRLASMTIAARAADGARATVDRGLGAARALLAENAAGRPLAAVGACTFGIPSEDGVLLAPNIPGWGEIAFGSELRRAFPGVEIRTATDVKAAAQAEAQWGALAGVDPGIYLNLGTGLAVAIVASGAVINGRHGASGEIAYNLRRVTDVGVAADARVLLEEAVSGKALRLAALDGPHEDGAASVFANADADPAVSALLAEFVAELAFHLVNLTIAIDPERVVVGGGMVRSWSRLHDPLRAALDAGVPFPPELMPARFPFDAPLMGALALATTAAQQITTSPVPAYSALTTQIRKGASI